MLSALGTLFASADGNVVAGGRIKPFAKGGVLASPMLFPLENRTGLAGEAGPEAIMPLQRGSERRLGVAAQGNSQPVTIHFNVTATDAASFRRSETQIAAMLNRMTSRGARNL
jgi:lambda family phage tail tape measure protein